jgi:hypothetical protein
MGSEKTPEPLLLAVAAWTVDPHRVAASLQSEHRLEPSSVALLVPARLAGLAWAGDPYASRPCAERQLRTLTELLDRGGVDLAGARVGDPEVVPAIEDALLDWPARRILLFDRGRRSPSHPLALSRRVERATRRPVDWITVPDASHRNWMQVPMVPSRSVRCA